MRHSCLTGVLLLISMFAAVPIDAETGTLFAPAERSAEGRFTNSFGELNHGSLGVRLPFFLRRLGTYFRDDKGAPVRQPNDGAFLRENAQHSVPTVTWVGHATLLVQMAHVSFLTDPTWSNRPSPVPLIGPSRYVKPGIAMADLPPIDFVVISHNHYDHLDLPTLVALAKQNANTIFFVPLGNAALLRAAGIDKVEELDWGQTRDFKGVTVHCLPAQHWSKRSLTDNDQALWSSWAVTGPERRFYFAGDTGYFNGFADIGSKLGPFDLVAVPIGAYEPIAMMRESHMNPEEALTAADDLRARRAVAVHFGTFDLSDEPLAEPPQRFLKGAASTNFGVLGAWVLNIGETRQF